MSLCARGQEAEREMEESSKERAVRRREVQALAESNICTIDKLERQAALHVSELSLLRKALADAQLQQCVLSLSLSLSL